MMGVACSPHQDINNKNKDESKKAVRSSWPCKMINLHLKPCISCLIKKGGSKCLTYRFN